MLSSSPSLRCGPPTAQSTGSDRALMVANSAGPGGAPEPPSKIWGDHARPVEKGLVRATGRPLLGGIQEPDAVFPSLSGEAEERADLRGHRVLRSLEVEVVPSGEPDDAQ